MELLKDQKQRMLNELHGAVLQAQAVRKEDG
uniref:Uncharacterized protein n=1 Tax=Setaria italica TaxID=4555 RepID=K4A4L9_SETIT